MLFQRVRYHYAHVHFPLYRGDPKGGDGLTNTELGVQRLGVGGFPGSVVRRRLPNQHCKQCELANGRSPSNSWKSA